MIHDRLFVRQNQNICSSEISGEHDQQVRPYSKTFTSEHLLIINTLKLNGAIFAENALL
jgi:hypothetical protein